MLEVELCLVKLTGKALNAGLIYPHQREKMVTDKVKEMGKVKGVPEWLNCSVWSSGPSNSGFNLRSKENGNNNAGRESRLQESAGAIIDDPLRGNAFPVGDGSSAEDGKNNVTDIQEPNFIWPGDMVNKPSVQSDCEIMEESKNETTSKLDESSNQKYASSASNQIDDPLAESWAPSDLDLPSIAGHSSPPQFSNLKVNKSLLDDFRRAQFNTELSNKVINLAELQRLASQGIPDGGGLRPTVWKLLFGYLPRNRDLWETELLKKRSEYAVFKEELLVNPSEVTRRMEEASRQCSQETSENQSGFLRRFEIIHGEHPLSLGRNSVWNQFFQDTETVEQIERDVHRTHPTMHFFSGDSAFAIANQEALKRILLIFAKLNPGIRYVQGMNEVVAPLFYVFKTDPEESNAANAEADTFFCFVQLLSDFRDHFCQQLDNSVVGIRSTMAKLTALLKKHDEELWRHLDVTTKVNPQFYAFRWITLLLTQEFNFPDSLRIWDSLLSNPDGPLEILLRVCCAMLMCVRSRLLGGDFTMNLKLLQHYPYVDTNHLLRIAEELRIRSVD